MRSWRGHAWRWRHSIKSRLVTLFLLLALATGVVFLAGMQRVLAGGWQGYAKPLVADYLDRLAAEIGSPPDPARAAGIAARLPLSVRIEGPQLRWSSTAERPQPAERWRPDDTDHASDWQARLDEWGLVRTTADGHRITFGLREAPAALRPRVFGWVTLALLLGLTAVAYGAVRRLLRPLGDITAGVEAYGRGEFALPIPVRRQDELGDLATRINTMATRLHGMLEAKRALLLAISHELRSPLTRARVNAELVPDGPARDALVRDLGEMRDLITDLLESERLAQGHVGLQAEPVDLVPWLRECVDDLLAGPLEGRRLELTIDLAAAPVWVDRTRLALLLRNLADNALRHGTEGRQPPRVFLRREADGRLALGVRDFGPGVPPEELERIAQAFYRPDSARTRAAGGVGLGLYLCRMVAEAHGGELRVSNVAPGLEVAMVWRA
jgi:signal transduction histidine kinase